METGLNLVPAVLIHFLSYACDMTIYDIGFTPFSFLSLFITLVMHFLFQPATVKKARGLKTSMVSVTSTQGNVVRKEEIVPSALQTTSSHLRAVNTAASVWAVF